MHTTPQPHPIPFPYNFILEILAPPMFILKFLSNISVDFKVSIL